MLIKVCGMRSPMQVEQLDEHVDFMGFIFYENSKRFVESTPKVQYALKIGVFVNALLDEVKDHIRAHALDAVQLHGHESPEMCAQLKQKVKVIKAFGVNETFDFHSTTAYNEHADYFLFDTKTQLHGGSGNQFDWSLLANYHGTTPFFLSGGIHPKSMEGLKNLRHPQLVGIDLNSGFEQSPGDKIVPELIQFIKTYRHENGITSR